MSERFAIYYAPATSSALWHKACEWLGRDAATSREQAQHVDGLDPARHFALTQSARRYGFHATLKAPMALAEGLIRDDLEVALAAFAARHAPVSMGKMVVSEISGFLALVPAEQSAELTGFAGECVKSFDALRAPAGEADRAKRVANGLTPRQIELLDQYGYPYVLEEFRLHMTLTDRLGPADHDDVLNAAKRAFADFDGTELVLDRLVLFHEPSPGAAFVRLGDFALGR
jgi:putative phosphonate metabolism protein